MADRFPSLDDFDAGQTTSQGPSAVNPASSSSTEPSDFLARERAALGDDAQLFATSADTSSTVHAAPAHQADDDDEDDDDLLGGGGDRAGAHSASGAGGMRAEAANGNNDMMSTFESSFPAVSTNPDHTNITNSSTLPSRDATTISAPQDDTTEPEPLRAWRANRAQALQHRDSQSAAKKAATVQAAQQAIDAFYEQHNNRRDKQIAQTRAEAEAFLKGREDTTSGGTSWERIAKLVDLSGKGARGGETGGGKERMRLLLAELKADERAPGAGGV